MNSPRNCFVLVFLASALFGFGSRSFGESIKVIGLMDIEVVCFAQTTFVMGCPSNPPPPWLPYSAPEHKVSLSAFAIAKYPVTVYQFCKFLNSRAYKPDDDINIKAIPNMVSVFSNRFLPEPGYSSFPARNVSPKAAEAFCRWVSEQTKKMCRLPTEAEWEYVAKGSEGRTYPWGEAIQYIKLTNKPVGSHPELATPEGVHDLNGPVYQWCADWYDEKYYQQSPLQDPVCTVGRSRVSRGGPMFRGYEEKYMMPATWKRFQSNDTTIMDGFRVVFPGYSSTNRAIP